MGPSVSVTTASVPSVPLGLRSLIPGASHKRGPDGMPEFTPGPWAYVVHLKPPGVPCSQHMGGRVALLPHPPVPISATRPGPSITRNSTESPCGPSGLVPFLQQHASSSRLPQGCGSGVHSLEARCGVPGLGLSVCSALWASHTRAHTTHVHAETHHLAHRPVLHK